MVEKFFLCPASTPAVEFDTLPIQLSLPHSSAILCKPTSRGVSVSTPGLSKLIPDLHQPRTTSLTVERALENATLPPEDDNSEEPPSQLCSQSRREARMLLGSNSQLPVNWSDTESVGLGFNTSTMSADPPNREQDGGTLALEGSVLHDNFLDSGWAQRDVANSLLPTPDWSSGFDFSTH
jgi:hypothetical protein